MGSAAGSGSSAHRTSRQPWHVRATSRRARSSTATARSGTSPARPPSPPGPRPSWSAGSPGWPANGGSAGGTRRPSARLVAQDVTDASDGVQQPRLALRLELAAHVADVHLEAVGRRGEVEAPDLLEDERAVEHPSGAAQEQLEQAELGAGELDRPRAAAHLARGEVHAQVGEGQPLVRVVRVTGQAAP